MNVNKYVDKKYKKMSLKDIAKSPVVAIQGINDKDAEYLRKAFDIKTVNDLARLKYVRWAQAICFLSEAEE